MKKRILVLALLAMTLALPGCSSSRTTETTAAQAAADEDTEEETDEDEEPEEDSLNGELTDIDGDIVTVLSADDGQEYDFDLSSAEITRQYDLTEGDGVYVEYYVEDKTPLTAIALEVDEPYLETIMDPVMEGTITDTAAKSITITTDNGEEYSFLTIHAYIVTADGIQTGTRVKVSYIGEPDDEPYAIKVVTEDSFDTEEAQKNGFVADVSEVRDGQIVLESEEEDFYTFASNSLDFSQFSEGDTVLIIYDGKITDKEITALEISLQ
ncbi:MAG: hypothetical protein LIO92_05540 [Clostridiales bacterium]|nr:hypothetical protein [Clostridiales bacterium]